MRAAAVATAVGFAVMSVELTAVRLMAPHFGDSAYVWTNVIGVILVALALGAWLGGKASRRDDATVRLALVLAIGAAWIGVTPWIADGVGSMLLPQNLALDAAMGALVRGSLFATLVLFAPPVLMAGMTTPMLVAALVRSDVAVGAASGHVAAWSTIGSLVGTFLTTHTLVPGIGSQWTLVLCAIVLLGSSLAVRTAGRGTAVGAVALLALLIPTGERRAVPEGAELLAQVESAYQFLRVVRGGTQDASEATRLQINEGLDSFHSIALADTPFTGGRYYDFYAALPFLIGEGARPESLRVLSLGSAAGTFERLLAEVCPDATFDSVELDPAVAELAEEHFGGYPQSANVTSGIDARVFVERSEKEYDLILVDAYERQIYIPAHVASREFFQAARARLADGGIIAVNAGGRTFEDPVVEVVAGTMATVFDRAHAFRVPQSRNFMIAARAGDAVIEPDGLSYVRTDDEPLNAVLTQVGKASAWREFGPGDRVLTDDRPFLDRVQDAALTRSIGDAKLFPMEGDQAPETAQQAAYAARQAQDLGALESALRSARQPTGALRFYAGDLRWLNHDLIGAQAEYEAAGTLGVPDNMRASLEGRVASVAAEVERLDSAVAVASRNTWLALGASLVLLAAFALAWRRL